jgi:hypothetical protein
VPAPATIRPLLQPEPAMQAAAVQTPQQLNERIWASLLRWWQTGVICFFSLYFMYFLTLLCYFYVSGSTQTGKESDVWT